MLIRKAPRTCEAAHQREHLPDERAWPHLIEPNRETTGFEFLVKPPRSYLAEKRSRA